MVKDKMKEIKNKKLAGMVMAASILIIGITLSGCLGEEGTILRTTGATFPQYQIQKWIDVYHESHPDVKIEYEGGGSGHGQDAFLNGLTQIGRSDPPVKEDTWNKFLGTGDQPLQFPEVVGAVVISYNVPGVSNLNLSKDAIVGIFIGDIEYWDNSIIKQSNPGVNLPHNKIIVIHRSDSSGTTSIFTTYLSVISDEWANKVGAGKTVEWPADSMGRGLAGKGNPGVVATLKQTDYGICYTELSFAIEENLPTASIENENGEYIKPTDQTIQAAVAGVKSYIPSPTEGYTENLEQLLNAPGNHSYPIVAFTHLLVWQNNGCRHYSSDEAAAIKDFLEWVLTEGQKPENMAPGYVGLPSEVTQIGLNAVNSINDGC